MIEAEPNFGRDGQRPVLFNREFPNRKHIDIQPLSKENKTSELPNPEFRDPHNAYLDIRFDFNRRLNDEDIEKSAQYFSQVIDDPELGVRHVSLKRKSSLLEDVNETALYWQQRSAKKRSPSSQSNRRRSSSSGLLTPDRAKGEDYSDHSPLEEQKQILFLPGDLMALADRKPHRIHYGPSKKPSIIPIVIFPSEGDQVDDGGREDEGVSYHVQMVLVRTAENCQSAIGWMRQIVNPRRAQR
ncbi:hypothetical protein BU16DRAFT_564051 [Lophium mytilinum]|uniref:Uncharacterized protein n=1 Tax=Lophium mytilinum TaxID=390894 RepID=A0A6A6QL20_9PEZI|nr:hypothetical protein BU16DRAFT_564051 [Lophium mytilinum]